MNVGEGRETYVRTIVQIVRERAEARPLVDDLRSSGKDVWDIDIPQQWRTAGFVQELTAAAYDELENDPRRSLALAQLGLAIATGIAPGTYPAPVQAQIEGAAWKEIGTAHRYMSEYDASLRAYDAAHRAYNTAHALTQDDAVVDFARAIVLVDLDRYEEALALLDQIEPVFRSFDDTKRLVQILALRGNLCTRRHRWEDARAIYERALAMVPADDLYTRSMLYQNLGVAFTELGRLNDAAVMLQNARQMFISLQMPVELNRSDWNIGRLQLQTGEFENAAAILRRVRDMYLEKGVPEEAGLTGLDLADALIALGSADDARRLVAQILAEFTAAKLNSRAITALAYLRDVLPTTSAPRPVVRHVRQYLDRLQSEPALLFLPPAE